MFSTAKRLGAESWNVFLVSETLEPVKAIGGFTVLPDYSFQNHPQIDLLIVVGGVHTNEMNKSNVLHWVASVDKHAKHIASVCTGAFILANAGLLKGLAVTTHWEDIPELKQRFPDLVVVEDKRWITASKYTTSGGISAGIDMSLFLVSKFHSFIVKAMLNWLLIKWSTTGKNAHNKRLKRDCQRVAFPVPLSRSG